MPNITSKKAFKMFERSLLYIILTIACLAPLPFGSDRPLPLAIIIFINGLLGIYWGVYAIKDHKIIHIPIRKIKWPAILIATVVCWIIIQLMPLNLNHISSTFWQELNELIPGARIYGSISVNPVESLSNLSKILSYIIIFWLSLQLAHNIKNAKTILLAIAASGAAYAIYGIFINSFDIDKVLWLNKVAYTDSVTATFINRNNYATYAGITLITSLALFIDNLFDKGAYKASFNAEILRRTFTVSLPYLLMVLINLTALLLSNSRAGIFSSLVGVFAFMLLNSFYGSGKKSRKIITITYLLLVPLFIIVFTAASYKPGERLSQIGSDAGLRGAIYSITANAIKDTPFLGVGLGGFTDIFKVYRNESIPIWMDTLTDHAHNSYLELALELGIPASLILITAFGIIFIQCFKGLKNRRKNNHIPAIAISSTILISTHALFDFSAQIPAIMIAFLVILATGLAQSYSSRKNLIEYKKHRIILATAAITIGCVLALSAIWQSYIFSSGENANGYKKRGIENIELAFNNNLTAEERIELLSESEKYFQRSLEFVPTDAYNTAYLAYTKILLNNDSRQISKFLATSINNNFYDKNLIRFRLQLIPIIEAGANEQEMEIFNRQLKTSTQGNTNK